LFVGNNPVHKALERIIEIIDKNPELWSVQLRQSGLLDTRTLFEEVEKSICIAIDKDENLALLDKLTVEFENKIKKLNIVKESWEKQLIHNVKQLA